MIPIFRLIILEKVKFVPSCKEPKNKKKINVFEVKLFFEQHGRMVFYNLETVQDFLIKLGIKPPMHLSEIDII